MVKRPLSVAGANSEYVYGGDEGSYEVNGITTRNLNTSDADTSDIVGANALGDENNSGGASYGSNNSGSAPCGSRASSNSKYSSEAHTSGAEARDSNL